MSLLASSARGLDSVQPSFVDELYHLTRRLTPMAELILQRGRHFGKSLANFGQIHDWIKAKTILTAPRHRDLTLGATHSNQGLWVIRMPHRDQGADQSRTPLLRLRQMLHLKYQHLLNHI